MASIITSPYSVRYLATSMGGTTNLILIDLDDTTYYQHVATNKIIVKSVFVTMMVRTSSNYQWSWKLGCVYENDDTDGSVAWFAGGSTQPGLTPFSQEIIYPHGGLDLAVDASIPYLKNVRSNDTTVDSVIYSNDGGLGSFLNPSASPGVGDVVLNVTEVTDGGTLYFDMVINYDTE